MVYYNEHDPFAAAWLRELIAAGHIAFGVVDERSIEDVLPAELRQFKQCHFFAGIGVWSYALRRAGWPDDRQIWTGSCPCQPFSSAGKGDGFADERHLWPAFHYLIEQCKPDVVLGEQVASKDGLAWLDLVLTDLEGTGYAAGAVDTCSAGFGAPHIRQRLYWMADSSNARLEGWSSAECGEQWANRQADSLRASIGMENAELPAQPRLGLVGGKIVREQEAGGLAGTSVAGGLCAESGSAGMLRGEGFGGMAYAAMHGHAAAARPAYFRRVEQQPGRAKEQNECLQLAPTHGTELRQLERASTSPTNGLWRDADWLFCRDGKWRPVESGTFPLVDGAAARVGRLRGYGNALNAEAAQGFIEAYMNK